MLTVGPFSVRPPLVAAPMAGLTHIAFRRLLAELGGVGLFYTEMLSSRALRHEAPSRSSHLVRGGPDRPLCLQIFASRPEEIAPAVEAGGAWEPEVWDLNFGCPAPEILRQGAGSALMESMDGARRMAAEMRRCVKGGLLFKIRVLEDRERFGRFLDMLAAEGADGIVVHARRPKEKLGRPARWERIGEAAARLTIPVIGNGDIRSAADVVRMRETTGCRGVMIGRAAVQRPWIFREAAKALGAPVPRLRYRRMSEVFLRFSQLLDEAFEPPRNLYRLKEFASYFAGNFKFGHQLWKEVHNARSMEEGVRQAEDFCRRHEEEDRLVE
jgi:nifR3 family TIM-barrel protein